MGFSLSFDWSYQDFVDAIDHQWTSLVIDDTFGLWSRR